MPVVIGLQLQCTDFGSKQKVELPGLMTHPCGWNRVMPGLCHRQGWLGDLERYGAEGMTLASNPFWSYLPDFFWFYQLDVNLETYILTFEHVMPWVHGNWWAPVRWTLSAAFCRGHPWQLACRRAMADFGKRQQENAQLSSYPTCQKINLVSAGLNSISLERFAWGCLGCFFGAGSWKLGLCYWYVITGPCTVYIFIFLEISELSVLLILDFLLRIWRLFQDVAWDCSKVSVAAESPLD